MAMATRLVEEGRRFRAGRLEVEAHGSREAMGEAAARHVLGVLGERLRQQGRVRVIFGCAPSQDEFLAALVRLGGELGFPWGRVEAFHMDEYVGLAATDPRSFRHYLQRHLLDHVEIGRFHPIEAGAADTAAITAAYARELARAPVDLVCMGIGENGHVAFNDPPVADFRDPQLVKVIELDPVCRQQQVNDGCFEALEEVPRTAVTITVPVFLAARALSCVVPNARKAEAVRQTIEDPIGPDCPSTLLRMHPNAWLFLDPYSFGLLSETSFTGS